MPRVIISSGHTTFDPGTVIDDLREVDVARNIAKRVVPHLRAMGVMVLSVPYDLDLQSRIEWINNTGYRADLNDLMVEVHLNEGGKTGLEAWYIDTLDNKSQRLAKTICNQVTKVAGLTVQGINNESNHPYGGINLLKLAKPISVLLECLYLDNPVDQAIIRDETKLDNVAYSIAVGVAKFLGINPAPAAATNTVPSTTQVAASSQPKSGPLTAEEMKPADFIPAVSQVEKQLQTPMPAAVEQKPAPPPVPDTANKNIFGMDIDDDDDMTGFGFGASSMQPAPPTRNVNTMPGGASSVTSAPISSMTRDQRKDMINKYYRKFFAKEPAQNDLNYFLNIGISEEQLLKRIAESQDVQDQIDNSRKYIELSEKYDQASSKASALQQQLLDQRDILEKLNSLLLQKNFALSEMQKRIQYLLSRVEELERYRGPENVNLNYKPKPLERFFNNLSKRLS